MDKNNITQCNIEELLHILTEAEDDIFCENLLQKYLNDDSPDKHDTITIEEFAEQEGIVL